MTKVEILAKIDSNSTPIMWLHLVHVIYAFIQKVLCFKIVNSKVKKIK